MSIGTKIKELREERKLTQEQVADALDVSFQAVSSWERNEYRPDIDKLIKLAELFDVSISAIAEEKRNPFKTKETVVEDCGKKIEELPVGDEAKEIVRLVSHGKTTLENRDRIMKEYYDGIASNPKAALVKCIDRCNNLTTMSWGLSRDKIYRTITETEQYFPRLLKVIKAEAEYGSASWLLQYQMESMLDIYKRLM